MLRAFVGLGGNVGSVEEQLTRAVVALGRIPGVTRVRRSSLWRTAPVGPVADQPWFINACAELTCTTPIRGLFAALQQIEAAAGRDRAHEVDQGPRPLDLDLLLYGDAVLMEPDLVVPHPRLRDRAFALAPLEELTHPEYVIPGAGCIGELLRQALARQPIVKIV